MGCFNGRLYIFSFTCSMGKEWTLVLWTLQILNRVIDCSIQLYQFFINRFAKPCLKKKYSKLYWNRVINHYHNCILQLKSTHNRRFFPTEFWLIWLNSLYFFSFRKKKFCYYDIIYFLSTVSETISDCPKRSYT